MAKCTIKCVQLTEQGKKLAAKLDGQQKQISRLTAQLEHMEELCKEQNNLYEKQNDLKGQKQKMEKLLE